MLQFFSNTDEYRVMCSSLTVNDKNLLPHVTGIRMDTDIVRKVVCQQISSGSFILDNLKFALFNSVSKLQVFWGFDFINIVVWLENTGRSDIITQFAEYVCEQPVN